MIIDCKLVGFWKPKGKDHWIEADALYYLEQYELQGYETEKRLHIVTVPDDPDYSGEILVEKVIPKDIKPNTGIHIGFYSVNYIYLNGSIYCTTTRHNI